jgi:hypothetical protein
MLVQPNPNPINKVVQNIDIHNVPTLSITPMLYDEIKLRSGRIVEPIIEDAPSSESDKESGEKPSADTEEIEEPIETYFKFFNLKTKAFLSQVSDFQEA